VCYYRVVDANSAVTQVESFENATLQIAQTTLRSVLGGVDLDSLLAERERRAKIINAEGEFQASERLFDAAQIMSANPTALQLRYLQTLLELGSSQASTIVFPLPIDLLKPLLQATQLDGTENRPAPVEEGDESDRTLKASADTREIAGGPTGHETREELDAEVEAEVEAQIERVKADVERVQADLAQRKR
jgi:hypothetical protein